MLKVLYLTNKVIGKTKIAKQFKDGAKFLDISDPERFTEHALRSVYAGKIVNDPHVNQKESQLATRHESISVQLPYSQPSKYSKVQKLKALRIEITKNGRNIPPVKEQKVS